MATDASHMMMCVSATSTICLLSCIWPSQSGNQFHQSPNRQRSRAGLSLRHHCVRAANVQRKVLILLLQVGHADVLIRSPLPSQALTRCCPCFVQSSFCAVHKYESPERVYSLASMALVTAAVQAIEDEGIPVVGECGGSVVWA